MQYILLYIHIYIHMYVIYISHFPLFPPFEHRSQLPHLPSIIDNLPLVQNQWIINSNVLTQTRITAQGVGHNDCLIV